MLYACEDILGACDHATAALIQNAQSAASVSEELHKCFGCTPLPSKKG